MKTHVRRDSDGLVLPIPASLGDEAGFAADTEVEVTLENGAVVARPVGKPRYTLDELVGRITDDNRHAETDIGPAVGREVW